MNNNQWPKEIWLKLPLSFKQVHTEFSQDSAYKRRERRNAHRKRMSVQQKRAAQGKPR